MRATPAFSGAVAALASIWAKQQDDFPNLQITGLTVQSAPRGNTTINFNIYDPSPLSNSSSHCTGTWNTRAGYAVGQYTLCSPDNSFEWTFNSYNSSDSFTLGAGHAYEDDNVGDPPYNYVTTYSQAPINSTNLKCIPSYGKTVCHQPKNTIIYAQIYALVA